MPLKKEDKKLLIISAIVLVLFLIAFFGISKYYEVFENKGLVNFCVEKCGHLELAFFNNNSDFLYIECNCVEDVHYDKGKDFPVVEFEKKDYYFDSLTMEEITKEEVDARIAHG